MCLVQKVVTCLNLLLVLLSFMRTEFTSIWPGSAMKLRLSGVSRRGQGDEGTS